MWSWINDAIGLVADHPEWALFVAFLAAIIEAVALLGTFIPGTFILMAIAGAAAAAGHSIVLYLVVAIAGAIIGDYLSYWVGYRYRFSICNSWPLANNPQLLAGADRFFTRFGSYSVALCRFVPVLRSTVPLVAGIAGMEKRRFLIANVLSAFAWAPSHVCPAQLAGLSLDRLRAGDWETAALWGGALVASCVLVWILHRRLTPILAGARR